MNSTVIKFCLDRLGTWWHLLAVGFFRLFLWTAAFARSVVFLSALGFGISLLESHWPWLFPHFIMAKSDWALVMLTAFCICEAGSWVGWNADPEDCMRVDCIDTRGAVDVESVLELVHCWNFVLSEIRSLNSQAMATTFGNSLRWRGSGGLFVQMTWMVCCHSQLGSVFWPAEERRT